MPGRNPQEAVDAFLEPMIQSLRVLEATTKIAVAKKGGYRKGVRYAWVLNGDRGADLGPVGTLFAGMQFEIIDCDPDKNEFGHSLRVTTRSYNYRLRSGEGHDVWRMHWHPEGVSPVTFAHLHLYPDFGRHLPNGRMTFENAIAWCAEYGAELTCSRQQAADQLVLLQAPHLLHRSWAGLSPPSG